jgi:hypothetical protein
MVEVPGQERSVTAATRIVEKAILNAPPNANFELRFFRDNEPMQTRSGLSREKLRRLIKFIADLITAGFQIVVESLMPFGAASGEILESESKKEKTPASEQDEIS